MRRTWICAASAAALGAVVGAGGAAARERQPGQDQPPSTQNMERTQPGETTEPDGRASAPRQSGRNVEATGATPISDESASRIADALRATASPQHFDVDVSVDGLLPGELDLRPLPPAVAELVPEYRGFEYAVANDEVLIVQPSTRRVVEIIR